MRKKIKSHRKSYTKKHSRRHRKSHRLPRKSYRKRANISVIPGSPSVPMFTAPDKKKSELIPINQQNLVSIVPGLRNYMNLKKNIEKKGF